MNIGAIAILVVALLLGLFVLVRCIRLARGKMLKHWENKHKYTLMTPVLTVLLQLVLITTYTNIVVSSSLAWYGTPSAQFVALMNLLLLVPFNGLTAYISGYRTKIASIVAVLLGSVLTMLIILALGSTGIAMLVGI